MPLSGKEMVKLFEKAGWERIRQKGSHVTMRSPSGRTWAIPIHKELRTGTEHESLKKLKESE
jgi:predicted RNA binding protein YcfA (HicA-like mRNA interferase family)